MANEWYDYALQVAGGAGLGWTTNNIKAVIVDAADYTPNIATDQFLSAIPAGARIATTGNLTGKTNVGGVLDADDTPVAAFTGDPYELVIVYIDTGTEGTSTLMLKLESSGLGDGTARTIVWPSGADKIARI